MARIGHTVDGVRVAQARQALPHVHGRQVSQAALAEMVGVHRVTVAKIENNDAKVSLELLETLSETLGVTRAWLLGEDEEIDPIEQAREQLAASMAKMAESLDGIAGIVDTLYVRVREEAAKVAA